MYRKESAMKKIFLYVFVLILAVQGAFGTTKTVGTTGADYATLKLAFDAINAGTLSGTIVLQIIDNTTEVASAVLNASGTGSPASNYTTVNIYPTVTGKTISGNLEAPLIDLSGADGITIDGRLNATGLAKDLTITNTNATATAGTSTIRFIGDASGNMVKYCTLKGSTRDYSGGNIFFSTGTTTGNDNNTIDNCSITNAGTRLSNALYTSGTSADIQNGSNTISNNNFYDTFHGGIASDNCIINIQNFNTAWTISGNSFYETTNFAPNFAQGHIFINIYAQDGDGFIISGNYLGGNAPLCVGTYNNISTYSDEFVGIKTTVGIATATEIQGNVIKNINWYTGTWGGTAIRAQQGLYNIGTSIGNTIGSATGNNSLTITGSNYFNSNNATYQGFFYGIEAYGCEATIKNNIIGSITTVASPVTSGLDIIGIFAYTTSGRITIQNNTIGSTDAGTTNSIYSSGPGATTFQYVYGIYSKSRVIVEISGNTISKLTNGATGSNQTSVHGIEVIDGMNTISSNTIRDLKIINQNPDNGIGAAVVGICMYFQSGPNYSQTVSGNTIYNLENSDNLFSGEISGIVFNYSNVSAVHTITQNFIHSLKISGGSATGNLNGINLFQGNTTTSNNIISLGGTSLVNIYGISDNATTNLYFNTVYIGGTAGSGTKKSAGLYNTVNSTTRNYRNNIFMNARSTTGGSNLHYGMYITTAAGALTCDYNDYFVSGTGGTLGYYGANITTLPIVTGATGNDAASHAITPSFLHAGGTTAGSYKPSAARAAASGTGIIIDYSGVTRWPPPTIGAIDNANPLPVELTSFTASTEKNGVTLKWKTATEINNYGFEIQRSAVSSQQSVNTWSKIGFVEGSGTTNAPKSYSFTDKSAAGKTSYRLKQIDRDGKFEYSKMVEVTVSAPKEFSLEQNYPNPFNPTTAIGYQLSANSFTTLKIYDAIGREVATLVNEVKEAGSYSAQFDGAKLSSGIYFANLTSSGKTQMRKLMLMK